MSKLAPRLVVAGTHSGVGKTTIATGLMAAFRAAGVRVASAKVGPDFIDPGYHSLATGRAPRNLDAWMCGAEAMAPLAGRAGSGADLLVIEGVMGLFDGAVDGSPSSTADVAILLGAPVVLVVDGSSMSASVAALVSGFRDYRPEVNFAGVILNRVGSEHHQALLTEALDAIAVPVLGTLGRDDALEWRDRHLGLVPVEEHPQQVAQSIERLGAVVAKSCDLEHLRQIAESAPALHSGQLPDPIEGGNARIAIAGGPAFTFSYRDNIEALAAAGAELIPFDPLVDEQLPENIGGLVVGGGFPEIFAGRLADNASLLADVTARLRAGLVTSAECGGLLWLCNSLDERPMVGAIDAKATMTDRLTLGYREATTMIANPLTGVGDTMRGHEFHYSTVRPGGDALHLTSRFADRVEGFASSTLIATYLHQHLGTRPEAAARFVSACSDRFR